MATTYRTLDWTGGPIGPGWFMLFAPVATEGVGSLAGQAPRYRPQIPEKERLVTRSKVPKEEDFAVTLMLLDEL